jgi:membrane protein DedA with SNARE-associated domain/membrane-associated phospholipid phosphatase
MDITSLKPLINWLQLHPEWGIAFAFLVSFAESIAIIGLIVPGSIIMAAVGLLVGSGVLHWSITFSAAILGAYCGDLISYWFGRHYHEEIRAMWPFRLAPKLIAKGEHFFKLHGAKSVIVGRFLGAIRPAIPVIAGMLKMPLTRFMIADFIAALFWAPAYMLPGILIGAASLTLPPEFATKLLLYLIVLLILLGLLFWFVKRISFFITKQISYYFKTAWLSMRDKKSFSFLTTLIERTHIPEDHTQLILATVWLICLLIFCSVTISVIFSYGLSDLNQSVYHVFRSLYSPVLQSFFIAITFLGNNNILIIFLIALGVWFLFRRDMYTLLHWIILGCFSIGLTGILKRVIISPRPPGLTYSLSGFSYPSGHVVLTITILGFFVFLISQQLPRYLRITSYLLFYLIVILVAISRLYLNAHWATDVIGGFLLGLVLLLPVIISYRRALVNQSKNILTIFVGLTVILLTWSFYIYNDFAKAKVDYMPRWRIKMMPTDDWWKKGLPNTPIIRKNRFDKPEQTLNIEWLGSLVDIKQKLLKANWQEQPKAELKTTINYIGQKDTRNLLPLFNPVYLDRYPVLVMAKFIPDENKLLILRLWDSNTYLYETDEPVWVGALSYYKPGANVFTYFIPDVTSFQWKKLLYPQIKRLNHHDDAGWQQQVLLIRPQQ